MAVEDSTVLALAREVTYQGLGAAQETVILSLASGYLYTCNDTTAAFLKALDGKRTFAEAVALLQKQFDVAPDRLAADMRAMAQNLLDEKIIMVVT